MNSIIVQYYHSPIGELVLGCFDERLCLLDFRRRTMRQSIDRRLQSMSCADSYVEQPHPLLQEARHQLDEYLAARRTTFDLPLLPLGTGFQQQVWDSLRQVPHGATISYQQLARNIGRPTAARAVAAANGANALAILIPCHRVVGCAGALTGYSGGLPVKRRLLKLERDGTPYVV